MSAYLYKIMDYCLRSANVVQGFPNLTGRSWGDAAATIGSVGVSEEVFQ
jgi:hypothetical protein